MPGGDGLIRMDGLIREEQERVATLEHEEELKRRGLGPQEQHDSVAREQHAEAMSKLQSATAAMELAEVQDRTVRFEAAKEVMRVLENVKKSREDPGFVMTWEDAIETLARGLMVALGHYKVEEEDDGT